MKTLISTTAMAVIMAAAAASTASAQDMSMAPSYGSTSLEAGFIPDPHTVELDAGGTISAESEVSDDCRGYISLAPDYTVTYEADDYSTLTFNVDSGADTTLVINGPDGLWYCDDDGADEPLNPLIEFDSPLTGEYNIWVGTYSDDGTRAATLFVSELGEQRIDGGGSGNLDISADAVYGNITLEDGFLPDPYELYVDIGGPEDIEYAIDDPDTGFCVGYTTAEPTVELEYTGVSDLYIYTAGEPDTTLAINAPDGSWHCSDDELGTDAGLSFFSQDGIYDIYVGTYSDGSYESTTLMFSEIDMGYGADGDDYDYEFVDLDIGAPAVYGDVYLEGGFEPDPYQISVEIGGPVDLGEAVGDTSEGYCTGYSTIEPTIELEYAGDSDLHIYTAGSPDTTLAINAPDGTWHCSDDAIDTEAGLSFYSGDSGIYDIYVGSFSEEAGRTMLRVSEIELGQGRSSK